MTPDYDNASKFSDTNYTASGIALDKIDDSYKTKVKHLYSIGNIYITGAGYVDYPIAGANPESQYGWQEFVWKSTPSRNGQFQMNTLDNISVGKVARCELNVRYMNYEDFRVFRKIVTSERYYMVKFFDIDENKWVCREMYCSENSRSRLYTLSESLIGVIDLSIKLVGTNMDLDDSLATTEYTVSYNLGSGTGTTPSSTSKTRGSQVTLAGSSGITAPTGKYLNGWQTKDSNGNVTGSYGLEQSITLWSNLALYAWYKDAE